MTRSRTGCWTRHALHSRHLPVHAAPLGTQLLLDAVTDRPPARPGGGATHACCGTCGGHLVEGHARTTVHPDSRGLYLPRDIEGNFVARCTGLLTLMPVGSVFSHNAAAKLWAMPLPLGVSTDIHITTPAPVDPPRRVGVVGHAMELPSHHVTRSGLLPVTTPPRTLFDLASTLSLTHLVAAADAALREGLVTVTGAQVLSTWGTGRRGVRRFAEAIELMDGRSESPPESALRVWITLGGLPVFEPNASVWDGAQLVARVDLLNERFGIAVEYEGSYHRSREQYASDIWRRSRLASLGFEVVQIEASMMSSPRAVVLHIASVLKRRGWCGRVSTKRVMW